MFILKLNMTFNQKNKKRPHLFPFLYSFSFSFLKHFKTLVGFSQLNQFLKILNKALALSPTAVNRVDSTQLDNSLSANAVAINAPSPSPKPQAEQPHLCQSSLSSQDDCYGDSSLKIFLLSPPPPPYTFSLRPSLLLRFFSPSILSRR